MKKLTILFLTLCSVSAFANQPLFKDCDSPECHQEKLETFERETLDAIVSNTGYIVADSLHFAFNVSENGEVEIMEANSIASTLNLIFAKKQLYTLGETLKAGNNYSWVWHIIIPKDQRKFKTFEKAKNFPEVPQCVSFNEKGRRACFRYVLEVAEGDVYDMTSSEKASFTFYVQKGKIISVNPTQLPISRSFTDKVVLSVNAQIEEMTNFTDRKNSDDFTIEMDFLLTGDSANKYADYLRRLDYLFTLKSKDMYLDEVLDFKTVYYPKQPKEGARFFLEKLGALGFDTLTSKRIKGRMYSMDSIRTIAKTGIVAENESDAPMGFATVESVPIFDGCSKYRKDNDDLRNCFQQKIMKHVAYTFMFPEEARMMGIQGRVYINFVVEKDGSFREIRIVKGADPLLDFESIRVVSLIPDAEKPAMQRGKPVRMSFTLPINAKLQ